MSHTGDRMTPDVVLTGEVGELQTAYHDRLTEGIGQQVIRAHGLYNNYRDTLGNVAADSVNESGFAAILAAARISVKRHLSVSAETLTRTLDTFGEQFEGALPPAERHVWQDIAHLARTHGVDAMEPLRMLDEISDVAMQGLVRCALDREVWSQLRQRGKQHGVNAWPTKAALEIASGNYVKAAMRCGFDYTVWTQVHSLARRYGVTSPKVRQALNATPSAPKSMPDPFRGVIRAALDFEVFRQLQTCVLRDGADSPQAQRTAYMASLPVARDIMLRVAGTDGFGLPARNSPQSSRRVAKKGESRSATITDIAEYRRKRQATPPR